MDKILGPELFEKLFPVILTDNGSEFSNPRAIEYRETAQRGYSYHRTNVFYCDAGSPYQKSAIEVNHELIRRILPKGTRYDVGNNSRYCWYCSDNYQYHCHGDQYHANHKET